MASHSSHNISYFYIWYSLRCHSHDPDEPLFDKTRPAVYLQRQPKELTYTHIQTP